jgi:hypothetical protein
VALKKSHDAKRHSVISTPIAGHLVSASTLVSLRGMEQARGDTQGRRFKGKVQVHRDVLKDLLLLNNTA